MTPPGREMAVRVPVGMEQRVASTFEAATPERGVTPDAVAED